MQRVFLFLFFYICFVASSFGQRNYAQELVNLLQEGKCFDARELRAQYADSLPLHDEVLDLLYKSHMSLFFNKPDSASFYLEKLLGNQNYQLILGPITGVYYGRLFRHYSDTQQFEAGINACDKMSDYLKRNPFMLDRDFIQNDTKFIQTMKASFENRASHEPRMTIKRVSGNKKLKLDDSEYIRFNAEYNGLKINTLFDTGVSHYFFIQEDLANEIGVKIIKADQDSTQMINGIPTKVYEAIIDSIDLNIVKLYNIPVLVFKEKFNSRLSDSLNKDFKSGAEIAFNNRQIIMGLPTMKLIGKLEFDWKNHSLSFPERTGVTGNNEASNIYLIRDNLYLQININGLNFVGYLDTGSNSFLNITFPFYEKNQDCIEIDTTAQKTSFPRYTLVTGATLIPCKVAKNINVSLKGKDIGKDNEILIFNVLPSYVNIFDGEMGVFLLKAIGSKVLIDFDDMKIERVN